MGTDIRRVISDLQALLTELDNTILRTATGMRRDAMTEAAIHLREAINKLLDIV